MKTEKYTHHGVEVNVLSEVKGKHRNHCLCYGCKFFKPDAPDNCRIAKALFDICKTFDLVTPVYECPVFEPIPALNHCNLHPSSDRLSNGKCKSCRLGYPPEDRDA